jgi:hypothetical protein
MFSKKNNELVWVLSSTKGADDFATILRKFNYTVLIEPNAFDNVGKMTFCYDRGSVKPSPRTLRMYGAELLGPIVKMLAANKAELRVEDLIDKIEDKVECQLERGHEES